MSVHPIDGSRHHGVKQAQGDDVQTPTTQTPSKVADEDIDAKDAKEALAKKRAAFLALNDHKGAPPVQAGSVVTLASLAPPSLPRA